MYALAVILARLLDDNPGAGVDLERPPAGDEIRDAGPAAATLGPRPTDPDLADFGLDIFGGP